MTLGLKKLNAVNAQMNQLKMSLKEQMTNCRAGRLEIEMLEHKVQYFTLIYKAVLMSWCSFVR